MKINVKARPNASEEKVEKLDEVNFVISVKEPPVQGKANRAIVNALAEYFGVASVRVKIVSGYTAGRKVIEIR